MGLENEDNHEYPQIPVDLDGISTPNLLTISDATKRANDLIECRLRCDSE